MKTATSTLGFMKCAACTAALLALSRSLLSAQTQTQTAPAMPPAEPPPPASKTEQMIKDIKNPFSWQTWGGDLRLRQEYFDNILTLSPLNPLHEQDYFRFRARVWASLTPVDDLSLNVRLATEPREWLRPAGYTPFRGRSGLDMTEGIFDTLNVQWKDILGQPVQVIVGRQDITLGEGWLTGDGTPLDGSWTYFLDAARLTYAFQDQHTTLEIIGILQNAKDDAWLPTINNQDRYFTEQNEKGAILNVVNTTLPAANLNGYFIYKHDNRVNGFDPVLNPAPRGGDSGDIYTFGGRLSGQFANHWKYAAEGAYQFGQKQDAFIQDNAVAANPDAAHDFRSLSAFGFNGKLIYAFKDRLNDQLGLSFEYLSGDDPKTQGDEMFDVLWGRYPRWSEIGAYMYGPESRFAQQANLWRVGPTWTFSPLKKLDLSASYGALFAPEPVPTRAANPAVFTGDGNFRGHFVQAWLKYKFNQHVSGHFWSEYLGPGDFYTSRAAAYFFRVELLLTF